MKEELLRRALDLCKNHGCRLIYLAEAGSHRYGTSTPDSDEDADGLFVVPKEKLLLGERIDHLKFTTKEDKDKNSSEDIDIKLYSIQYFLQNLLKKCDTNAIDILYSHTNHPTIIQSTECAEEIFNNKDKLLSITNIMKFSYTAFSISQAKKYGIKSSKLGLMRHICDYLEKTYFDPPIETLKLEDRIHDLLEFVPRSEFITIKDIGNSKFLLLDGKLHQLSIALEEFKNRVQSEYEKYGKRTRLAEQQEGVDWKSLSHSLRGIFQMEDLYHEGGIKFPLKQCELLRDIKTGKYSFGSVERFISDGLERLESLKIEGSAFKGKRDEAFIDNLILNVYR